MFSPSKTCISAGGETNMMFFSRIQIAGVSYISFTISAISVQPSGKKSEKWKAPALTNVNSIAF